MKKITTTNQVFPSGRLLNFKSLVNVCSNLPAPNKYFTQTLIRTTSIFLLLFHVTLSNAQDEELLYQDHIYLDNIKSVKFHLNGSVLSYPIIDMRSGGQLSLIFDDLDEEVKDYVYTFVHCDYNWKPSNNISEMDYLDGFSEDNIDEYDFSFNTLTNYTNYQLRLPNQDMRWTKSGNYLLKVYDITDEKMLAITRRFVVVDPLVRIIPNLSYPSKVSKGRTHHEVDFVIDHKGFEIRNPQVAIKVVVMQNGRWDNAVKDLPPLFVKQEQIIYDYQDKITFPAGKEFRFADLRTFQYKTQSVSEIYDSRDGFDVTLIPERSRINKGYLSDNDINGQFVIESLEERDYNLRADYASVLFTLKEASPFHGSDVYLYGGMTDWGLKDEFKMTYNDLINAYVAKPFLKQGFYNYVYAVVNRSDKSIDLDELEGSWYETENDYTILVYYTPFGGRYDQLISAYTLNSAD